MNRRAAGAVAAVAVVVFGLGWGLTSLFPVESQLLAQRFELFRAGVRGHQQTVQVSGVSVPLHFLDQAVNCDRGGSGGGCPCVALIHGHGDQAMTWRKLLAAESLPRGRYLAIDLPGNGESPAAPKGHDEIYRIENQVRAVRDLMEKSCPASAPVYVVGNSLGGWIAATLALRWPERVSKVLLLSPAGLKIGDHSAITLLSGEPSVEKLQEFQKRAYAKPREIPPQVWKEIVKKAKAESAEIQRMLSARNAPPEEYLDPWLPSLKAQTILFWGLSDRIIPPTDVVKWKAYLPGIIVRQVERCGHMPQKECPGEVIRALADLAKIGPA